MSADTIIDIKTGEEISYSDEGVFAFHLYYDMDNVDFSIEGDIHGNLYDAPNSDADNAYLGYIPGRIWTKQKIIAFWHHNFSDLKVGANFSHHMFNNDSPLTFKQSLKLIEEKFNSRKKYQSDDKEIEIEDIHFDKTWLIDVPIGHYEKDDENYENIEDGDVDKDNNIYYYYNNIYTLVPLDEFIETKIDVSGLDQAKEIHLLSPEQKRRALKELGYKPKHIKTPNGMSQAQYRNKTTKFMYTENVTPFKLFESPDEPKEYYILDGKEIIAGNLHYCNKDAIPFGYVDIEKSIISKKGSIETLEREIERYEKFIRDFGESADLNWWKKEVKEGKKSIKNIKEEIKKYEKLKEETKALNGKYYMMCGEMGEKKCHYEFGSDRSVQKFNGRLWYNRKYISFWKYPPTYEQFVNVIKDIEKSYKSLFGVELGIYKDRSNWVVEIGKRDGSEVVHFKDYMEGKVSPEEMAKGHIEVGKGGEDVPKGFGSRKYDEKLPKDMTQAQYRNKKTKYQFTESVITKYDLFETADTISSDLVYVNVGEDYEGSEDAPEELHLLNPKKIKTTNRITKFKYTESFDSFRLNESPDNTLIPNTKTRLHYNDRDAMAFGYYKNKFYISLPGNSHGELTYSIDGNLNGRMSMKYPGRFWLSKQYISFWVYPDPKILLEIVEDLENMIMIDISDWNIEVPIVDGKIYKKRIEDTIEYEEMESKFVKISEYKKYW